MEVETRPPTTSSYALSSHLKKTSEDLISISNTSSLAHKLENSMSQGFQQGIFSFSSNGINQQNQREKLRVQGYVPPPPLVAIDEESSVYEGSGGGGGGMLSEMFNFQSGMVPAANTELLDNQISQSYRSDWHGMVDDTTKHHHQMSNINADSAVAMQLFLMNPQPRSPSPPQPPPPPPLQRFGFDTSSMSTPPPQFTWVPGSNGGGDNTTTHSEGVVDNQGLSLSLSSLQHLQAAKAEELSMGESSMIYFNQGGGGGSSNSFQLKNLNTQQIHHQQQPLHLNQQLQHVHVGYSPSSFGVMSAVRNSKFAKPAQELLEEFCSIGRGHMKNNKFARHKQNQVGSSGAAAAGAGAGASSSSIKDRPPLSSSERMEYQRKKAALLSMLDEVDRRYNHYCEQMQIVVNSFDSVMGYGAATPYTSLAQKAMSRHFRCLKDAIAAQLKQTREIIGEKNGGGSSGVTKGETPRLKLLDQSLRQQRAFHQMGMMEQETWRPQRGLPERSVNILRAWLFEHFLSPYPTDADKHLLARQTGLSRNQVSNWFINARVRLWKPMVEEMYQQESKEEEDDDEEDNEMTEEREEQEKDKNQQQDGLSCSSNSAQTQTTTQTKRSEVNAHENDPSLNAINRQQQQQCFSEKQAMTTTIPTTTTTHHGDMSPTVFQHFTLTHGDSAALAVDDTYRLRGVDYGGANMEPTLVRYGTTTGDVSLTLGLQHAGNLSENNRFSVSDFGSC